MKYSFCNDYSEGAHSTIMDALLCSNMEQSVGYGEDAYCRKARERIQEALGNTACDVHFLVGGTQANTTVIAAALRPYEAVIAVDSGHINVHETGAIEASGHKVIAIQGTNGKLDVQGIRRAVQAHEDEHMVKPAMVYISNATELGTIYTKKELCALHEVCQELDLYLFMDGARLGAALCARDNDVMMQDLCQYIDVFYIGGTKNGALFGEAVVIVHEALKRNFRYMIKQRGGMLAKGRLLGIQFLMLMDHMLYLEIAKHANQMADCMRDCMTSLGIRYFVETTTNQIFPILPNMLLQVMKKDYEFQIWCALDDEYSVVRFVTSWATPEEVMDSFCSDFVRNYTSVVGQ